MTERAGYIVKQLPAAATDSPQRNGAAGGGAAHERTTHEVASNSNRPHGGA